MLERLPVDDHRDGDQRDHQDLESPRQHRVRCAHDQRIAVEEHTQGERNSGLFQQDADQHFEPADGHHPAESRMGTDQQEERADDEQQQEAELEQDQRDRDQQHEDAGDKGGEQGCEGDLQPGGPLLALE